MTAITLSNINKRFGEKVLFRDYSLHIEAGEFVAIKGESGAGKNNSPEHHRTAGNAGQR